MSKNKSTFKRELDMLDSNIVPGDKARMDDSDSLESSDDLQNEYTAATSNKRLIDLDMLKEIMSCKVSYTEYGSQTIAFVDKFTI